MKKKVVLFVREFYKIFIAERILREAGSLTFITVLGFVPFTLFLLTFLPSQSADQVQTVIKGFLMPEQSTFFDDLLNDLFNGRVSMNVFNITMLIVTSYSLFNGVATSFDRILRIEQKAVKRTFGTLLKVFGMMILGFFVFTLLISTASLPYFQEYLPKLGILLRMFNFILPLIFWFLLINVAYYFLPNANLSVKDVMKASLASAVVWFVAKMGFDSYIKHFTGFEQLYGMIASVPIFLFWIYLNWILVLCGVIIMAILNGKHRKPKDYFMTAQITLSINRKIAKDYIKEIQSSDDEDGQLRALLADWLLKKGKKK